MREASLIPPPASRIALNPSTSAPRPPQIHGWNAREIHDDGAHARPPVTADGFLDHAGGLPPVEGTDQVQNHDIPDLTLADSHDDAPFSRRLVKSAHTPLTMASLRREQRRRSRRVGVRGGRDRPSIEERHQELPMRRTRASGSRYACARARQTGRRTGAPRRGNRDTNRATAGTAASRFSRWHRHLRPGDRPAKRRATSDPSTRTAKPTISAASAVARYLSTRRTREMTRTLDGERAEYAEPCRRIRVEDATTARPPRRARRAPVANASPLRPRSLRQGPRRSSHRAGAPGRRVARPGPTAATPG